MSFKGFPEMINCYGRNDISYESIGYISRVKLLQILSRMSSKAIQKWLLVNTLARCMCRCKLFVNQIWFYY